MNSSIIDFSAVFAKIFLVNKSGYMEKVDLIWMDGDFVPWDNAKVHVLSHTLHYGDGVFEGIRFYETEDGETAIFRLDEHLKRLISSAAALQMTVKYSNNELENAIKELIKKNNIKSGYVRPLIFYGYGKMGLHPKGAKLNICIAVWPWISYLGETMITVKTSSNIRIHPKSTHTDAKICGHYSNSLLAHLEALNSGYDEGLLLDYEGNVAEGPVENIFAVINKTLVTPPENNILAGITRNTIIKIARDLDIPLQERKISLDEIKKADEIFFTGTASEITGIKQIDDDIIADGNEGEITKKLKTIYTDTVHGKIKSYLHWLTYV